MARPFKSKFIPYVDQIRAWRRAGKTWKEVAKNLTAMGVKADAGNVCRVMARIKRRPYPIGAEPEIQPTQSNEQQSASSTLAEKRAQQLREENKGNNLFNDNHTI